MFYIDVECHLSSYKSVLKRRIRSIFNSNMASDYFDQNKNCLPFHTPNPRELDMKSVLKI